MNLRAGQLPGACASRQRVIAGLVKRAAGVQATWEQGKEEVVVRVPVDNDVRARDVKLSARPKMLKLEVKGQTLLEGTLEDAGEIVRDGCFFNVMDADDVPEGAPKRAVVITLEKKIPGWFNWEKLLLDDAVDMTYTRYAWIRVAIDGQDMGRILFGLYGNVVPKTVENFAKLCEGFAKSTATGEPLSYKGCRFHKVFANNYACAGDITNNDGTGGESIFGPYFEEENFILRNREWGDLGMTALDNGVNSQFYINLKFDNTDLDYTGVVFGRAEIGLLTLREISNVGTVTGAPSKEVTIIDAGELHPDDVKVIKDDIFEDEKRRFGSTLDPSTIDQNLASFKDLPGIAQSSRVMRKQITQELDRLKEEEAKAEAP